MKPADLGSHILFWASLCCAVFASYLTFELIQTCNDQDGFGFAMLACYFAIPFCIGSFLLLMIPAGIYFFSTRKKRVLASLIILTISILVVVGTIVIINNLNIVWHSNCNRKKNIENSRSVLECGSPLPLSQPPFSGYSATANARVNRIS